MIMTHSVGSAQKDHLLLVDDDPMTHRLVEFVLKDEFYRTSSCLNAEDGKAFIENHPNEISLVVLDWEMPGMNGLEVLRWMKETKECKDIPVVMLTAHTDKEDIQTGIDGGAYYYLTKPFNPELLKTIVRVAINDHRYLRHLNEQLLAVRNPFKNLSSGSFQLQTMEDAENMSLYLANASSKPEEVLLVSELLYNAIEHGNLGITYEEKTQLIEEDKLLAEIAKRLSVPENSEKYAVVECNRLSDSLKVVVEDQGKGFDYSKYLKFDEERVFDNHGRGIAMVNSLFNLHFYGNGNKVELTIPI